MDPETLITEARARIIWGESPDSVRSYLTDNGMPESEADARIKELKRERNNEIRKMGLQDTLIGLALVIISVISFFVILKLPGRHSYVVRRGRILALPILGGCYGLWKLGNGILNLAWPQSEHESIPDISE